MVKSIGKRKVPIFKCRINPAFHRHPKEGILIGRLVVAFGELELMMAMLAAECSAAYDQTMRVLYRLRTTSTRLALADVHIRPIAKKYGLSSEYAEANAAVSNCLEIRNRYAHAQWADDQSRTQRGLFFTDLQKAADQEDGLDLIWFHAGLSVLRAQYDYFVYAQDCLFYLQHEIPLRAGKSRDQPFPMPQRVAPPTAHSDPEKHIPPWLSEGEKAQHLARARAMAAGTPVPTAKQKSMDAAKAAKLAKKAEHDRRSQERDPKRKI